MPRESDHQDSGGVIALQLSWSQVANPPPKQHHPSKEMRESGAFVSWNILDEDATKITAVVRWGVERPPTEK